MPFSRKPAAIGLILLRTQGALQQQQQQHNMHLPMHCRACALHIPVSLSWCCWVLAHSCCDTLRQQLCACLCSRHLELLLLSLYALSPSHTHAITSGRMCSAWPRMATFL
jgi:hypothetical protein